MEFPSPSLPIHNPTDAWIRELPLISYAIGHSVRKILSRIHAPEALSRTSFLSRNSGILHLGAAGSDGGQLASIFAEAETANPSGIGIGDARNIARNAAPTLSGSSRAETRSTETGNGQGCRCHRGKTAGLTALYARLHISLTQPTGTPPAGPPSSTHIQAEERGDDRSPEDARRDARADAAERVGSTGCSPGGQP